MRDDHTRVTRQLRVCVDFDDTLIRTNSDGEYEPVPGAAEFMRELAAKGAHTTIYTCRTGIAARNGYLQDELELIAALLKRFSIPYTEIFAGEKPIANVYIDDRAIGFRGNWEVILQSLEE